MLVQSKERGPGARDIAAAELAEILAHAALAVRLNDEASGVLESRSGGDSAFGQDGDDAPVGTRLAVVTNGKFGSSLPATGWTTSLDTALARHPSGAAVRETLLTALEKKLEDSGLSQELAPLLLARIHLIQIRENLGQVAASLLEAGLGLHPALASLLRARLQCDLAEVAAAQRQAKLTTAVSRSIADLDAPAAPAAAAAAAAAGAGAPVA